MSKVTNFSTISDSLPFSEFRRFTAALVKGIVDVVNGQIEFGANIRSNGPTEVVLGTSPLKIPHTLRKVPGGFIVVRRNANATVFQPSDDAHAWTGTEIWLQSNATVTVSVLIF